MYLFSTFFKNYKYFEKASSSSDFCFNQTIVSTGCQSLKTIKVGIDITLKDAANSGDWSTFTFQTFIVSPWFSAKSSKIGSIC